MCGIFGLTTNFDISFKDLNYEIKNFVRFSDTRGSDAFGISIKIDDKNDIMNIGKILYYLNCISDQNIENKDYYNILKYLKKYEDIIIYNDRINLRIRDILKKSKINLGYLAKHLINEDIDNIILSPKSDDMNDINNKLKLMTQQYYKYKGKYLTLKMSELSSI